jgi:hypothetical protein
MQRESIWRQVSTIGGRFQKAPPEGKIPVIEIALIDGKPFQPTVAREQPPWVIFEIPTSDDPSENEVLIVPEGRISQIHFRYESKAKVTNTSIGFRVEPLDSSD